MHTSRNIRNAGTISIYLLFCNPVKIYEVWSMKYEVWYRIWSRFDLIDRGVHVDNIAVLPWKLSTGYIQISIYMTEVLCDLTLIMAVMGHHYHVDMYSHSLRKCKMSAKSKRLSIIWSCTSKMHLHRVVLKLFTLVLVWAPSNPPLWSFSGPTNISWSEHNAENSSVMPFSCQNTAVKCPNLMPRTLELDARNVQLECRHNPPMPTHTHTHVRTHTHTHTHTHTKQNDAAQSNTRSGHNTPARHDHEMS